MSTWKNIRNVAMTSVLVASSVAGATTEHQNADLGQFLKEFHQNPVKVMDQLPAKKQDDQIEKFQKDCLGTKCFVEAKDEARQKILPLLGRAGFEYNDLAENLVDNGDEHVANLGEMDEKQLHEAELSVQPWSDDYWAIAKGILGHRYADPNKNDTMDWKDNKEYAGANTILDYLTAGLSAQLSPSEKYDLLVGDENFSLTAKMWSEGEYYYNTHGKVETWMGICHGWAPAAYMLERPTKAVEVLAADGETKLTFYPSDIKSLASLLWANASAPTRFVGGRCNTKNPEKDENGRIKDQDCFDTNPGTWHKSVVNQIGVANRSFVIDATYDYEVWNQPVSAYQYRYFNVNSYQKSADWKSAAVKVEDYARDKFKTYRSKKAKYIVGVEMGISYIAETAPSTRTFDNDSYDYVANVVYRYDLEVDAKGNIVGGEWYSNAHPDFLWTPPAGAEARSRADDYTKGEWKDEVKVPGDWQRIAPYASKAGLPLAKIVKGLINRAK